MKQEHRAARKDPQISLHEFKMKYNPESKDIYCFVEGEDDITFYKGFVDNNLPDDKVNSVWFPTSGKQILIQVYDKLESRELPKSRILFFIDRDLSEYTGERMITGENVYITDGYSIENSIVNYYTCRRVLQEICGFKESEHVNVFTEIETLFSNGLDKFKSDLRYIMVEFIIRKKHNQNLLLSNIKMKECYEFKKGVLCEKMDFEARLYYISKESKVTDCFKDDRDNLAEKFDLSFVRGKFLMWFLVSFCLSIHSNCVEMGAEKRPKMSLPLSEKNCMALIATRCRIPESLSSFLQSRFKTLSKGSQLCKN